MDKATCYLKRYLWIQGVLCWTDRSVISATSQGKRTTYSVRTALTERNDPYYFLFLYIIPQISENLSRNKRQVGQRSSLWNLNGKFRSDNPAKVSGPTSMGGPEYSGRTEPVRTDFTSNRNFRNVWHNGIWNLFFISKTNSNIYGRADIILVNCFCKNYL